MAIAPAPVPVRDTSIVAPPRGARFYTNKRVGSEAQFNPLSLVVNGGFDELRLASANRHLFELDYDVAAGGVWESITRPDRVIRAYGFDDWVKRQLLPLSGKKSGGGQWEPNYHLHLFGGGMTGVRITEWFGQHGYAHAELDAAVTVAAWHLMTEMIEHQSGVPTADAMTDLLIFDPAAFLLWRNDRVQRLFSTRAQMTNWSGQPAFNPLTGTLQNMQQTAMIRVRTPWSDNYRPFSTSGASFLVGMSRRKGATDWISLAGGWDPTENPVIDPVTGEKTVVLNPNIGLFYDRDGSLLAGLHVRLTRKERAILDVYPGVVHLWKWSPGLYVQLLDDGRVRFGLVPRWGVGLGME